jgi:hypothetical protein
MGSTTRQQVLGIVVLALAAASVSWAQQQPATPVAPNTADPAATTADPDATPAAPPEAPVTPPKVVCTGSQMTISANNSTLSAVLAEVHTCMGTKIDLPEGAGDKHMFDRIGPGPASEVLDEFLSATGYNYIIGSSPSNQDKIDSIMLLARAAEPASAANIAAAISDGRGLSPNRRAFLQMRQAAVPHPMTDADTAAAEAAAQATSPAATPSPDPTPADATTTPAATTDSQPAQPAETNPTQPQAPTAPPTSVPTTSPSTGAPATTQDQITNMQQMFELRKQLNQQQQQQTPPQP